MRRRHILILAIAMLVLVPYWYLLLDGRADDRPVPRLDIAQLRALAGELPGEKPVPVTAYVTALDHISGNLLVAGSGFRAPRLSANGYVLHFADSGEIVIDTGLAERMAAETEVEAFSPVRRQELDQQIENAEVILLTSTAPSFASGIAGQEMAGAMPRLMLGKAQRRALSRTGWIDRTRLPSPAFDDAAAVAVAPGVVSIPARGFGAGSRMVFVSLANGRELLFTGDNALVQRAWTEAKPPARFVTDHAVPLDRGAIRRWLRAIRRLHAQAPALTVVSGHDTDALLAAFEDADGTLGTVRFGIERPGVFREVDD